LVAEEGVLMYLTAQRVISYDARQGINAYVDLLADRLPTDTGAPASPSAIPTAIKRCEALPPAGNRVRSFLDIVAPAPLSVAEVQRLFDQAIAGLAAENLGHVEIQQGALTLRFGLEASLAMAWRREVRTLFETALHLAGA
jgi:hypothetical protein